MDTALEALKDITPGLAFAGFLMGFAGLIITVWEKVMPKAKLELDFEWVYDSRNLQQPESLRVNVSNVGRKKDSAREIGFNRQRSETAVTCVGSINRELPIVLDVDTVKSFSFGIHPQHPHPTHRTLHQQFASGAIQWAYVKDARRRLHWYPVPPPTPPGPELMLAPEESNDAGPPAREALPESDT